MRGAGFRALQQLRQGLRGCTPGIGPAASRAALHQLAPTPIQSQAFANAGAGSGTGAPMVAALRLAVTRTIFAEALQAAGREAPVAVAGRGGAVHMHLSTLAGRASVASTSGRVALEGGNHLAAKRLEHVLSRRGAVGEAAAGPLGHAQKRTTVSAANQGVRVLLGLGKQRRLHTGVVAREANAAGGGGGVTAAQKAPSSGGGLVGWYLAKLEQQPWLTKMVSAGLIMTLADAITQVLTIEGELPPLSEPHNIFDFPRLFRMACIGFFLWGPTLHLWYNFLGRVLPGTDLVSSIKKMALGQVSYGPTFTASFFSINGLAQGETPHELYMRLKRDLLPTLLKGLCYWPFCDILNFRYVPVRLQPLGNNAASLIWTIYITYVASAGKTD